MNNENELIKALTEYKIPYLENKILNREAKHFLSLTYDLFFNTPLNKVKIKISSLKNVLGKLISAYGTRGVEELSNYEVKHLVEAFLSRLARVREFLYYDATAIFENDPAATSKSEIILCYPGFYALFVYRLAHELYLLKIDILPRLLTEIAHTETGIDISAGATIGKYLSIDHGTGIVIGETTVIMDHVNIYQGVTLGALSTRGGQVLKGKKRHPTIMSNVTIYANATILGGDTVIGEGVTIKANAFITESVNKNDKL